MTKKTLEERINENIKKQEQLKARERDLRRQKSEQDRKKRTKRLIELGGIIESVLGRETEEEDRIRLMNFLNKQERNGHYFTRAMNENQDSETAEDAFYGIF